MISSSAVVKLLVIFLVFALGLFEPRPNICTNSYVDLVLYVEVKYLTPQPVNELTTSIQSNCAIMVISQSSHASTHTNVWKCGGDVSDCVEMQ